MREFFRMKEIWIGGKGNNEPKCNIYISDDFGTNTERCLVLIQGTGAVRAGVWARSVCVNEDLSLGSVFPMLQFARDNNFSVIVLNPNMAEDPISGAQIQHCQTMQEHCNYVWENFIAKKKTKSENRCAAERLAIVAHSAGGRCVADWTDKYKAEFMQRVEALVFTDAYYHAMWKQTWSKPQLTRLRQIGIHFRAYKQEHKDLGVLFKQQNGPITEVSAGTSVHTMTTGLSTDAALSFILERFSA